MKLTAATVLFLSVIKACLAKDTVTSSSQSSDGRNDSSISMKQPQGTAIGGRPFAFGLKDCGNFSINVKNDINRKKRSSRRGANNFGPLTARPSSSHPDQKDRAVAMPPRVKAFEKETSLLDKAKRPKNEKQISLVGKAKYPKNEKELTLIEKVEDPKAKLEEVLKIVTGLLSLSPDSNPPPSTEAKHIPGDAAEEDSQDQENVIESEEEEEEDSNSYEGVDSLGLELENVRVEIQQQRTKKPQSSLKQNTSEKEIKRAKGIKEICYNIQREILKLGKKQAEILQELGRVNKRILSEIAKIDSRIDALKVAKAKLEAIISSEPEVIVPLTHRNILGKINSISASASASITINKALKPKQPNYY